VISDIHTDLRYFTLEAYTFWIPFRTPSQGTKKKEERKGKERKGKERIGEEIKFRNIYCSCVSELIKDH
jgi:hypothetical protein